MAIVDFHEKLQMKLNELRDKAKLPKEKVSKVTVEKEPTPEPVKKAEPVKEKPVEKEVVVTNKEYLGSPTISEVDDGYLYQFKTKDGLIGGVMTSPTTFRIDGISANEVGKGKGSKMFEALIEHLKTKGVTTLTTESAGEGAVKMHDKAVDKGLLTKVKESGRAATFTINDSAKSKKEDTKEASNKEKSTDLITPEGFTNRTFDSNIQLGKAPAGSHISEKGYNYRVLSKNEIDAIINSGGVFAREGKQKGGNSNTKYWTKGNGKNWYGDKENQETIRVKDSNFSENKVVSANDVEVYNKKTGKFESLNKSKETKPESKKDEESKPKEVVKDKSKNEPKIKEARMDVIPISRITTDEARFQNRKKLKEHIVKNIAENFDSNQLTPLDVWEENGKTLVLAGHHRLEGAKRAGVKSLPVKYFEGTEQEAIDYAIKESNSNRTMETPIERANIYRKMSEKGVSKKEIVAEAKKNEGNNANFILNVAALNPNGMAIQQSEQLEDATDQVAKKEVDKALDWIGEVRKDYSELTNQHEDELFKFLMDKDASKRITTKSEFQSKISSIVSAFDFDAAVPLNIARFKYKSQGEIEYDKEAAEFKAKIAAVEKNIADTKDRFTNPANKGYINPNSESYQETKKIADKKIELLNEQYRKLNKDYLTLQQNKGKFTQAGSDQGALFQKKAAKTSADIQKVVDVIKKALPKFTVKYDDKLDAAGKIQGNVITINPDYAGIDTPIHEAGHALIDFLGYKNSVVQSAIKQLKTSPLWTETKERYPELNDEMLAKEVLAEAIGREGAGIFDTEVEKSKFMQLLDRIFDKLKTLLGINKNVAKSLAKQIIRGETKNIESASAEVQLAKAKREVSPEEQDITDLYNLISNEPDLSKFKYEDLVDAYNFITTSQEVPKGKTTKIKNEILKRMGMNIFQRGIDKAKTDPQFSEEKAIKKDISYLDRHIKVLTHFSEAFPEMKFLADKFQEAFFEKTKEARQIKNVNEKLAIEVIKDRNKRIGITQRAGEFIKGLFGNQNYKYFDYLDNGKGQLYTVEEGKKKGFSAPQLEYLKFVREEIGKRQGLIGDESYNTDMDVLKMDKKFYENFLTENAIAATSSLLGNTHNINNVRIEYTDPDTGKKQITEYENIEKALIKYGNKGSKEKVKAMYLISKYNRRARLQLKENVNADEKGQTNTLNVIRKGDYSLDDNGQLRSKFDKPRDPKRAYSKDFYTAMQEYIDDTQHIKHISPLLPIINSIEYLNKTGVYEFDEQGNRITKHAQKDNVAEWLKGWIDLHIIKRPNETDPAIDNTLKFFRTLTSLTTMMFNATAQGMNVAIGLYNNWRKENSATVAKGLARLFTGSVLNKKARAIIHKYGAVSTDMDSNPIPTAGNFFTKIGFLGTKWGEYIIQGSGLLGKMSDEDYNSFEFKKNSHGIEEIVIKDSVKDKKALEKRILDAIDEVSDVQGKYSEKDRMNFANNELGKSVLQFKQWVPMWFRARFGDKGSWTTMYRGGLKEIRNDIRDKGFMKTLASGKDTQAVKDFKSNLKGAMMTGLLISLSLSGDDDDKKTKASAFFDRALKDLLFVFDPQQARFTISRPIASIGTVEKFLDALSHLMDVEADDYFEKLGKDVQKLTPGAKKISEAVDFLEEEN